MSANKLLVMYVNSTSLCSRLSIWVFLSAREESLNMRACDSPFKCNCSFHCMALAFCNWCLDWLARRLPLNFARCTVRLSGNKCTQAFTGRSRAVPFVIKETNSVFGAPYLTPDPREGLHQTGRSRTRPRLYVYLHCNYRLNQTEDAF